MDDTLARQVHGPIITRTNITRTNITRTPQHNPTHKLPNPTKNQINYILEQLESPPVDDGAVSDDEAEEDAEEDGEEEVESCLE